MLRRHHRFVQSLQILSDVLGVALAFACALQLRFSLLPEVLPHGGISAAAETRATGLLVAALWPVCAWMCGLYRSRRTRGALSEIFGVLRATAMAFLAVVTWTYFMRDARYSRGVLLLWAGCTWGWLSCSRVLARMLLQRLRSRGYNLRHVAVVGTGALAQRILAILVQEARFGLRPVGVVALPQAATLGVHEGPGLPLLGTTEQLAKIVAEHQIDQIIVALSLEELGALRTIMAQLSRETVDVRLVPDLDQYVTLCGSIEEFGGLPMINLQTSPLEGWNRVLKRSFDACVAAILLLVLAPLLLLLGLGVRLSGPGPIFFCQQRVGMDGRSFAMFKLRTMRVNTEAERQGWTVANDARCTPLGAWLRRLSLDELPQLFNVLRGDMSLVGPRPERPCFIENFKQTIPRYALRHKIKAGMTGWAQVNGMRGNTSLERRIELDLYYIENWSLRFDLHILVRTALGGFLSPNAY